jgi:8-oxo-dGTP pyrophosphatase MutT (NUDIX family)
MNSNFEQAVAYLRERLGQPLPGRDAYMLMAPQNPGHRVVAVARAQGCREGGVLALLYPVEGQAHLVLTVRSESLRTHAGQISLPGGRIDPGEDAMQAALREAWEELGIVREELDILGTLSELYIPPSNFCLTPVVAATHRRPDFRPHDAEVAALIEAPMYLLSDPATIHEEMRFIAGEERRVPYFLLGTQKVWGATAMILAELVVLWREMQGAMTDDGRPTTANDERQ